MSSLGYAQWLSLDQVSAVSAAATDPVLVLPLGAVEQHGRHLPLGTDLLIVEGLLEAARERLSAVERVYLLPSLAWGASQEHASYPGTLSLSADTLVRVLEDVGASVAASGVRRLLICNAHGGNRAALDTAALSLRRNFPLLVVKAHYFRVPLPTDLGLPASELREGLHDGAIETAMMLALRPDLVRQEALTHARSVATLMAEQFDWIGPEGASSFAWLAEDLHPSGVVGDATLATAQLGRRLVDLYAAALAQTIDEALRIPLHSPEHRGGLIDRGRLL